MKQIKLFIYFLLAGNVFSLSNHNPNEEICKNGICRFGMGHLPDGSCYCCISCQENYHREKGNIECPLKPGQCSDKCLPGFEQVPKLPNGYMDFCKRSKTTTESSTLSTTPHSLAFNETDQSYIPVTNQPNPSNSNLYWIIVPCVVVPIAVIIVCALIKRKKKQDPDSRQPGEGHDPSLP